MGVAVPGRFREIWLCDFEFEAHRGEVPDPVCAVFKELKSGRVLRLFREELRSLRAPPISIGPESLFVAYFSSAELGCFLSLGWPLPNHILDLYAEFRAATNGREVPAGNGLLGAMVFYGLEGMSAQQKSAGRELVIRGGPWTNPERVAILKYCESDVTSLEDLFVAMLPDILGSGEEHGISFSRALLRGRYMKSVAKMERTGIPVDVPVLAAFREHWEILKHGLIELVDKDFGVYDRERFVTARFESYLVHHGLPWPRLENGNLALDKETFRMMARACPRIAPLRELRRTLSELRLNDLAVGGDGRNRCLLSPFRSKTGRNQPSNSNFLFGLAAWLRSLIKPNEGSGLAYIDFNSQELGIAAALSGDTAMQEAYHSGDPYLDFAKRVGLAPKEASKASHGAVRDRCKALVLGLQYGMTEFGLARNLNVSRTEACCLIRLHQNAYPTFWRWSNNLVDHALFGYPISTQLGWPLNAGALPNPRSIRNFPMQANGAEILRLACTMGTEAGITVCAPVHDAVLIEAPIPNLAHEIARMQGFMRRASEVVLSGFALNTSFDTIAFPDRYMDKSRGKPMWDRVMALLAEVDSMGRGPHPPQLSD